MHRHLARDAGQRLAQVARFALQAVAQDVGVRPAARATCAAASSAIWGAVIMRVSARASLASPGLMLSPSAGCSSARTAGGSSMR
jgi:hypothetical protein